MTAMKEKKVAKGRMVKTLVPLPMGVVPVYSGRRVAQALHEVTVDMDIYHGVRLRQLLEAVYQQGEKDGARRVKVSFEAMMKGIPHQNPGKPKKKK